MRKLLSVGFSLVIAASAFGGGHKRGCDCEPCEGPPVVPQEVTLPVNVLRIEKRDFVFLVEKRVPRELVTQQKCLQTVPGCCEPQEVIVETRCPVTEIVQVPQRQTVRWVTLVPQSTLDMAVPVPVPDKPYCPPKPCD